MWRHETRFSQACVDVRANRATDKDERPPDLLTVEEAGAVLRLSRGKAYELANEYLNTQGASGIPVLRLCRVMRVPRAALEEMIGAPITWPIPDLKDAKPSANGTATEHATVSATPPQKSTRTRQTADGAQLSLLGSD
jgi:hypothetical protein